MAVVPFVGRWAAAGKQGTGNKNAASTLHPPEENDPPYCTFPPAARHQDLRRPPPTPSPQSSGETHRQWLIHDQEKAGMFGFRTRTRFARSGQLPITGSPSRRGSQKVRLPRDHATGDDKVAVLTGMMPDGEMLVGAGVPAFIKERTETASTKGRLLDGTRSRGKSVRVFTFTGRELDSAPPIQPNRSTQHPGIPRRRRSIAPIAVDRNNGRSPRTMTCLLAEAMVKEYNRASTIGYDNGRRR